MLAGQSIGTEPSADCPWLWWNRLAFHLTCVRCCSSLAQVARDHDVDVRRSYA